MLKHDLLSVMISMLFLSSCSRQTIIIDYPPLDWTINAQRIEDIGCLGNLKETCPELVSLGCDEVVPPGFFLGGLQPPYAVMECIHHNGETPNGDYFRQLQGMDQRYRSFVIHQDGRFRLLIQKEEFKDIIAPIEQAGEAISYAMAMTSLDARFDLDTGDGIEFLVDKIEETHAEETPDGYLVYLFDWSHKMGCDIHPFYAVKVIVTKEGDVREVERKEIYRSYACFDFEELTLE